jgi:hypothetical protein
MTATRAETPTRGAAGGGPGWIDLFDGASLDGWTAAQAHTWRVAGGVGLNPEDRRQLVVHAGTGLMVNGERGRTQDLQTVAEFGSCEIHVEWCVPAGSNSGVYVMGLYEIQILDSWGEPEAALTYKSCGAIYPRRDPQTKALWEGSAPRTNASRPPGEWQTFDVVFRAAGFDDRGRKVANACFERVLHNGVLIQEHVECSGPTGGATPRPDAPHGPLRLQGNHGPVAFRSVRVRPLDKSRTTDVLGDLSS